VWQSFRRSVEGSRRKRGEKKTSGVKHEPVRNGCSGRPNNVRTNTETVQYITIFRDSLVATKHAEVTMGALKSQVLENASTENASRAYFKKNLQLHNPSLSPPLSSPSFLSPSFLSPSPPPPSLFSPPPLSLLPPFPSHPLRKLEVALPLLFPSPPLPSAFPPLLFLPLHSVPFPSLPFLPPSP